VIERMCKSCGTTFPQANSLQTICGKCAYNKYAKPHKPIKKLGRISKEWIKTRQEWIKDNSPVEGIWKCYLCGKPLTSDTLTLDHMESRSRHPELRFDKGNLAPCCYDCNRKKGSRSLEEVR
jgi:hypothetical protein